MERVSKAYQRLTDNDDDDDDDRSCIHDNKINEKSVEEILPLKKDSLPFQTTLDVLPKDILHKIFSYLCLSDLICLEYSSQQLRYAVMPFWKLYCERYDLRKDPTPLCVGWQLNDKSLYSYDNAVTFCNYSVKRWRLLAIRCFLVETYRCVICGQHLKDRLSVDGFYFKHDVLLCFPDCYNIFTMNVNDKMLEICEQYGVTRDQLAVIDSTFPVLLVTDFIKTLRSMEVDERQVLTELRPYLGYETNVLREYYNYIEGIRTLTRLL